LVVAVAALVKVMVLHYLEVQVEAVVDMDLSQVQQEQQDKVLLAEQVAVEQ
jgi:hypothetical protein